MKTEERLTHLSAFVSPGTSRASSLLLVEEGRILLAVRPPIFSGGRVLLRLTGVGGWAEGDETFAEAAYRESLEETGSHVRLIDLGRTLIVRSPDDIEPVEVTDEVAPAAVVFRRFGTTPFEPWSSHYQSVAPIAVYVATLVDEVRIVVENEHPLFIWLYPEQLISLVDEDEPLEFLLADGAIVVGETTFDRQQAVVRLTDSIQSLLSALGPRAFSFLCDFARLYQPAHLGRV